MRGLTGNILRTFSTQVPSIIISIISGVFLTRLLGAEGKGIYAIFFANMEIMVMIFAMGCDMGIIYFGSNKKISHEKLQAIAIWTLAFSLPILFIFLLTFKSEPIFPDGYNDIYFRLFLFGIFALTMLNTFFSAFLKAIKRFKPINRIALINSILNLTIFSILFYLNSIGFLVVSIKLIFGVSLSIMALNTLLWSISFFKNINLKPNFSLSIKKDVLTFFAYIWPVFISIIINFFNYRLDIWIVAYYKGTVQLGLYVLAVNFAQFILLYSKIIGSVMMPYLSEDDVEKRKKTFTTYSRINFTSVVLMVLLLYLFGKYLIRWLYGIEFTESVAPFNILIIGILFSAMSQLFSIMLFSKGKNNVALIANSLGLISTVIFDFLLIPKYGIMGAAIATSISYFVLFLFLLYHLIVKERLSFMTLFILRTQDLKTIFSED